MHKLEVSLWAVLLARVILKLEGPCLDVFQQRHRILVHFFLRKFLYNKALRKPLTNPMYPLIESTIVL